MIQTWSIIYAVGWEGNIDFGRQGGGNFAFEYFGRRGVQTVGGVPAWSDDRSVAGTGSGGGTYRPPAGSLVVGRGRRASTDRDRLGAARDTIFAAGVNEPPAALAVALVPNAARSASRATSPAVGWRAGWGPALSRSVQRSRSPNLAWRGETAPRRTGSRQRATVATLNWATTIRPTTARQRSGATSPVLVALGLRLGPAIARHRVRDIGVAVLPDLLFATPRMVRIEGEVRVQIVNP